MAVEKSEYEESRKERMEENKKRMQELGILELSKDLKGSKKSVAIRKAPVKRKFEEADSRRSSRVAAKPAVDYKDQLDLLPGMRARCGTRERVGLGRRYVSDLARRAAYEAAEEAFKEIKNPGFVKAMLHSHVSSCFWLGLPHRFCQEHMPQEESRFVLEDDKGEEWECLFLAHKTGLSGGWRGFSLDHELVDGDSCIFELVSPLRFKVHFFRIEEGDEVEPEEVEEKKADPKTEKKAGKAVMKKKPGKKTSKKVKVEDEDDNEDSDEDHDDDGDDYAPRVVATVAGPSRASRRKPVKEEVDGKNSNDMQSVKQEIGDVVKLESGEDNDARKSAAVTKSAGRATRNSLRRSLT